MKQRIIGIAVLVIAAIAVFPLLLNRSSPKQSGQVSFTVVTPTTVASTPEEVSGQSPPQPQPLPTPMQPTPTAPAVVATKQDTKPITVASQSTVAKTQSIPNPKATKTYHYHALPPKAWVVQLGSFSSKTNADHLLKSLQRHGFHAYARSVKTQHSTIMRIFVGPEINRHAAEMAAAKLHKTLGLKGIIVRYEV